MKNLMAAAEQALLDQALNRDGLNTYTQGNCQVSISVSGVRIYRPPNHNGNVSSSGGNHDTWGGLRLRNADNIFNLIQGHTYVVIFDVRGQSSNDAISMGWSCQMGWGNPSVHPNPSDVEYNWIGANFSGSKTCWYKFTISDSLYKTCTSDNGNTAFVIGTTYLSYMDFMFGFGYQNTGSLGTDLYISNIRMYDITNLSDLDFSVNFRGEMLAPIFSEGSCQIHAKEKITNVIATDFIEI